MNRKVSFYLGVIIAGLALLFLIANLPVAYGAGGGDPHHDHTPGQQGSPGVPGADGLDGNDGANGARGRSGDDADSVAGAMSFADHYYNLADPRMQLSAAAGATADQTAVSLSLGGRMCVSCLTPGFFAVRVGAVKTDGGGRDEGVGASFTFPLE